MNSSEKSLEPTKATRVVCSRCHCNGRGSYFLKTENDERIIICSTCELNPETKLIFLKKEQEREEQESERQRQAEKETSGQSAWLTNFVKRRKNKS